MAIGASGAYPNRTKVFLPLIGKINMLPMRTTTYLPKHHISTLFVEYVRGAVSCSELSLVQGFAVQHNLVLHVHLPRGHDWWWSKWSIGHSLMT